MKHLLSLLLALSVLTSQAQTKQPPTLTFRQGNSNQLDMIVSSGGQLLTPSASLSITAEVRVSDVGRIVASVPMVAVDTVDGTIRGALPSLAPGTYYLGLFLHYRTDEADFRVGVGRIEIVPTGSLKSIADASGLNVIISENKTLLDVKLDATPSSSIAAFYAQQARSAVLDGLTSYSLTQASVDAGQNTSIAQRVTQGDFNTYKTNAALSENSQNQIIATKANASDVYAKSQTYSQAETDAKKPDFEIVSTFSEAQTKSVSGKPKVFILTNDTPYGGSSVVIWSGSSFTVLPGIPRTN